MSFILPSLAYEFSALEPHIDAKTMEIHYSKHHQAYIDKLNAALENTEFANKSLEEIIKNLEALPDSIRQAVRNNGGGHYNHSLFWELMTPDSSKKQASKALIEAIDKKFGSMEKFINEFDNAAMTRFGSGWAWLIKKDDSTLAIVSTPNQDNPIMDQQGKILLGVDVWEHAYYLNYQNRRADYLSAWWNVINWEKASELFES
jgi:Fe-Mn family superoxide dismutase